MIDHCFYLFFQMGDVQNRADWVGCDRRIPRFWIRHLRLSFLAMFYMTIGSLIVSGIAVPWILIIVAIVMSLSTWLFIYSMAAYRDSYRIEAVAWSPLLSYFQETFKGNTVIRSFGKEKDFMERANHLLNKITLANQIALGIFGWYSMRSDYLATFMLVAGCTSSILLRN